MNLELDQVKQRQRAAWAAGNFDAVADLLWELGDDLVDRAGIVAGERVLDVGAGTGNAAIAAAEQGAEVVASDLTPELFDAGRARAAEAGVELEWVEADAEDLPFGSESFDVVLSCFGHIFAPRHRVAAEQILRVTRPGGRFALTAWVPDSPLAEMMRTLAAELPPPPDFAESPLLWGDPDHATTMFEGTDTAIELERSIAGFEFPDAESLLGFYEENLGMVVVAKAALEPQGRWGALRDRLLELFERRARPKGDAISLDSEYLIIHGRRR